LSNHDDTPAAAPDWPKEDIPDDALLYMRAHKSYVQNGELQPAAIRDIEGGMSVNWQKYCARAAEARRLSRVPQDNGIVSFPKAGDVRSVATKPPLTVEHTPDLERPDRSHSEIYGDKKATGVRVALLRHIRWEIRVEAPVE
jgi:hypothetical protein